MSVRLKSVKTHLRNRSCARSADSAPELLASAALSAASASASVSRCEEDVTPVEVVVRVELAGAELGSVSAVPFAVATTCAQ
jgi:hypothetical protein